MTQSPYERYEAEKRKLEQDAVADKDREKITEFVNAKDERAFTTVDNGDSSKTPATLRNYCQHLRLASERIEGRLVDASADDINQLMQSYFQGSHPDIKDGGLTKNSVSIHQGTLRKFCRFHDEMPDDDEIAMLEKQESSVSEDEMYTDEEVQELRNACKTHRESALLDMLLYTGQRVRAIQSLRIKDVDVEAGASGKLRLRDDIDGLKGASGSRPLLGAQGAVRRYLNHHPCSDDPEAALFTGYPDYTPDEELGEPLHHVTINRQLKKIRDRTDVDKPVNAHNFRHHFVTVAKVQYDLDNDRIKKLIGHRPDSRVMETTYSHLTVEDATDAIEVAAGHKEAEDESSLSPPTCPTCSEPLPTDAKACANCGATFTPDAQSIEDEIDDATYDTLRDADDESVKEAVDKFRELLDDPEIRAAVIEDMTESKE